MSQQYEYCAIMESLITQTVSAIILEENMQEMDHGLLLLLLSRTTKTSAPPEETGTLIAGRSVFT